MTIPYSRPIAAGCVALAAVAFGVASRLPRLQIPAVVVALAALGIGATATSRANGVAASLQKHVNRTVSVLIWGDRVSGNGETLILDAAYAIMVGLHLRLRSAGGGRVYHIKIAQPTGLGIDHCRVEVRDARYVSCDGRRVKRPDAGGAPALHVAAAVGSSI